MDNSSIMNPRVSLVLPCRNEHRHIEACLDSILNQESPVGGFEVIVADGMSDDGTREILARMEQGFEVQRSAVSAPVVSPAVPSPLRLDRGEGQGEVLLNFAPSPQSSIFNSQPSTKRRPTLRVIDNPGRIVSKGLNAAIRAARGMIIVRFDAHTEYAPDYVCRCIDLLQETQADNVGGPARTKADTFVGKAIAAAYHSPFAVGGARFHNVEYEGYVDTVTYGCWPRVTFEKFGLFDEELVRNQDDEHNLRISRGGGKIYQSPHVKSWYRPRASLRAVFQQYMQYGYWKVRVIQKHKLPASWRHLVPGVFVLTLLGLLLLTAFSWLLSALELVHRPLITSLWHLSSGLFLCLLVAYSLAVTTASVLTARQTEWRLLPVLPLVFPCYHFSYGCGFLRGLWDFVVRRRGAATSFQSLTR